MIPDSPPLTVRADPAVIPVLLADAARARPCTSALPGYLYVIVGREGGAVNMSARRLVEDRGRLEEVGLKQGTSR